MNKKLLSTLACIAGFGMLIGSANADHIWINEFHYDNAGGDVNEFVEVGMRLPNGSGFSASDYAIQLYNGNGGTLYNTTVTLDMFGMITPSLPIAGSANTITLFAQSISGIQNGAPDGIALVNTTNNTVAEFISYEGAFMATDGIAAGMMSVDIGVEEGSATLETSSLSAVGLGFGADQFGPSSFAVTVVATPGQVNSGQIFTTNLVPEPGSLAFLGSFGVLCIMRRRR